MKFVIDEKEMEFVGEQVVFDQIEDAIIQAKTLSFESNNLFVISEFHEGEITHVFIEGVCYKREVHRDFKLVK